MSCELCSSSHTMTNPAAFRVDGRPMSVWIWLRCHRYFLYPLSVMDNTTPATKADLQTMKEEILKAIADMNRIMQAEFQHVHENIEALQKDVAEISNDLDSLCETVDQALTDAKVMRREFGSRIRRLERRLAIVA